MERRIGLSEEAILTVLQEVLPLPVLKELSLGTENKRPTVRRYADAAKRLYVQAGLQTPQGPEEVKYFQIGRSEQEIHISRSQNREVMGSLNHNMGSRNVFFV